jgi:hypothetical protein
MFIQLISLAAAMALAEPQRLVPDVDCRIDPVVHAEPVPGRDGFFHATREGWSAKIEVTWATK